MRRAARTDATHADIAATFRTLGCKVISLAGVGFGCPDLLVSFRGRLFLVECKDGEKPPSERKLTPAQVEFHRDWPVFIVDSIDAALRTIRSLRKAVPE